MRFSRSAPTRVSVTLPSARGWFSTGRRRAPAAAQQGQPNPNQTAAKAILQDADKAIGASSVKSIAVTGTGRIGSPGQQFAQGDLPRADLKSYSYTADFGSKSAKTDYVRVQGNTPPRRRRNSDPRRAAHHRVGQRQHRVELECARPACCAAGQRRRGSPAADVGRPVRLHQGWPGGPKCGGHRPVFRPAEPDSQVVGFNVKVCDGPCVTSNAGPRGGCVTV
jgi:hypothetical protein